MRALAAVALCLALLGCQSKKPGLLHIDPELEALVPADTVFVVGANLDAIRDTPVYTKLLSRVPLPQLEDFARQTGLDPRKDLSEILSCTNGKHGLMMARGRFNRADLETRLKANGLQPMVYKGHPLFGDERAAVVLLNVTTAIGGPAAELRKIIDGDKAGRGIPPALRDLLRTLPPEEQIYAVLTGGLGAVNIAAPPNSNLGNVFQTLKSVDNITLGMDLRNGFHVVARADCKTERDAKFVHDMVKGVVGLGRLNTPDNQGQLLKLYDAIQVKQQQSQAQVTADIPQDLADKFLDLWLKQ